MQFGVVDINLVFKKARRSQALSQKLELTRQTWAKKLKVLEVQREKLVKPLEDAEDPAMVLDLQRQLQGLEMELSYIRQHSEADLKAMIQQSQQTIMQELAPHLAAYAKENKLSVVFAAPNTPIMYLDPAIDITDAVVAYFDKHSLTTPPAGLRSSNLGR